MVFIFLFTSTFCNGNSKCITEDRINKSEKSHYILKSPEERITERTREQKVLKGIQGGTQRSKKQNYTREIWLMAGIGLAGGCTRMCLLEQNCTQDVHVSKTFSLN